MQFCIKSCNLELSSKVVVRDLVEVFAQKGVKHIVISPGSRNAPLTISFNRHPNFTCYTIVDERCAAFFAMGLAQQLKEPVAICCTSGSASLNYAPAIVEAYYQKIPLLVITADRPPEWIDQMDGQTIRQSGIYQNFIKGSYDLPVEADNKDDRWYSQRIINEAIEKSQYPEFGPVHINVPLREPLYELTDYTNIALPKVFSTVNTQLELPLSQIESLKHEWSKFSKILIVTGLLHPNDALNKALGKVAEQDHVSVLTETTSNLFGDSYNRSIDRVLISIEGKGEADFKPDLLVTLGGPIVSKKIKTFLRIHKPIEHWHINASNDFVDTYKSLTKIIPLAPEKVLCHFTDEFTGTSNYRNSWLNKDAQLQLVFNDFLKEVEFCDLKAFEILFNKMPAKSNLQLANSTVVRYSNLFDQPSNRAFNCFSNRGTSGIDGTLSTAVGAAKAKGELTTVITGDLSFFYDSNALWIAPFPQNLKIVMINNKGGSIFRIIDGPAKIEELESFFEVKHNLTAENIAKTFGIDYYFCNDSNSLSSQLNLIYGDNLKRASLLEVSTENELNPEILKRYFKRLKK